MDFELEVIISILESTVGQPASHKSLNPQMKLPAKDVRRLTRRLQNEGLVYVNGSLLSANRLQRLSLAVRAVQLGGDIERISKLLEWREFEDIAAVSCENNGYRVQRSLRFKGAGRRWEIDLVCLKGSMVVCIDCKHWQRGLSPSALRRVAQEQMRRTETFAASLPSPSIKLRCDSWDTAKFIPVVLSLVPCRSKFQENVPIVPILQLQDFLHQLPAFADSLGLQGSLARSRVDDFSDV